jgi:hypothetical protein
LWDLLEGFNRVWHETRVWVRSLLALDRRIYLHRGEQCLCEV